MTRERRNAQGVPSVGLMQSRSSHPNNVRLRPTHRRLKVRSTNGNQRRYTVSYIQQSFIFFNGFGAKSPLIGRQGWETFRQLDRVVHCFCYPALRPPKKPRGPRGFFVPNFLPQALPLNGQRGRYSVLCSCVWRVVLFWSAASRLYPLPCQFRVSQTKSRSPALWPGS